MASEQADFSYKAPVFVYAEMVFIMRHESWSMAIVSMVLYAPFNGFNILGSLIYGAIVAIVFEKWAKSRGYRESLYVCAFTDLMNYRWARTSMPWLKNMLRDYWLNSGGFPPPQLLERLDK